MKLDLRKCKGRDDFVVLDGIRQSINPTPELIRALADRRFGIGADQVLLLEAAKHEGEPLRYRIFNNTGGEVEQCGNGARCIGRFALEAGYAAGDRVDFETMKGAHLRSGGTRRAHGGRYGGAETPASASSLCA